MFVFMNHDVFHLLQHITEVQKFNNQLHNLGQSNYLFIIVHYLLHLISVFLTSIIITALHENNVSHSYMFVRVQKYIHTK